MDCPEQVRYPFNVSDAADAMSERVRTHLPLFEFVIRFNHITLFVEDPLWLVHDFPSQNRLRAYAPASPTTFLHALLILPVRSPDTIPPTLPFTEATPTIMMSGSAHVWGLRWVYDMTVWVLLNQENVRHSNYAAPHWFRVW